MATFQQTSSGRHVMMCVECGRYWCTEQGAIMHENQMHDGAQTTWPATWNPQTGAYEFDRGHCPDGGTCHHGCLDSENCYRVEACGPLSGVYPGDRWPS